MIAGISFRKSDVVNGTDDPNRHFLRRYVNVLLSCVMFLGLLVVMLFKPRGAWALINKWVSTLVYL